MTKPLSPDQQAAYDQMVAFILDPTKTFFVLEGFAGSGKSTLMYHFMEQLGKLNKAFLAVNSDYRVPGVNLTATTHKAAENLSGITGESVFTIHSTLGLMLRKNYRTHKFELTPRPGAPIPKNMIIIIDEASYIDLNLLHFIKTRTEDCKIIFMGDPYQLVPVGYSIAPVFQQGYETARLTGNHRNGGAIQQLSAMLRNTIDTGDWFQFKPDGQQILHVSRDAFNDMVLDEFTQPDWKNKDSRIVAYTNERVIEYNNYLQTNVKGTHEFLKGDYGISNKYTESSGGNGTIQNGQTVFIQDVGKMFGQTIPGKDVLINHNWYFLPDSQKDVNTLRKEAMEVGNERLLDDMDSWLDLRAPFSETVNKSQGSTYGKVYVDLDDISRASNGPLIARLLYVAASRAKEQVILTGDLV